MPYKHGLPTSLNCSYPIHRTDFADSCDLFLCSTVFAVVLLVSLHFALCCKVVRESGGLSAIRYLHIVMCAIIPYLTQGFVIVVVMYVYN